MKHEFIVKVELPADIPVGMMTRYIREAVQTWRGSFGPDDSFCMMNDKDFSVKYVGVVDKPKKKDNTNDRDIPISKVRRTGQT